MQVEIWSDVVCPWCYLGKRRFEQALEQFDARDSVQITWRSFELDPTSPKRIDGSLDEMLAAKMGATVEQARAGHARLAALGEEVGIEYHFEKAQHGNTFDAHRLIHLAAAEGKQDAMKERLMRAYFTDGQPIGDVETLVQLASEVGLDAATTRAALSSDACASDVRADERRAQMLGVSGVPFFVFDEHYAVSGAQPTELFLQVLQRAWDESDATQDADVAAAHEADDAAQDGAACAIDGSPAEGQVC